MITAEQARQLSGITVAEYAAQLETIISNAAKTKVFETIVTIAPFNNWLNVSQNQLSDAERGAIALLRRNGFKLSLFSQGITTGLKISW